MGFDSSSKFRRLTLNQLVPGSSPGRCKDIPSGYIGVAGIGLNSFGFVDQTTLRGME